MTVERELRISSDLLRLLRVLAALGAATLLVDTDVDRTGIVLANLAPVNAVPGAQATDEDTTLTFSSALSRQISVSDIEAGLGSVKVTLTGTRAGGAVARRALALLGGAYGRRVVVVAGKGNNGIFCGAAIELRDGTIVTGKNSPLMHAATSLVLNHRQTTLYEDATARNQVWASRLGELSTVRRLLAAHESATGADPLSAGIPAHESQQIHRIVFGWWHGSAPRGTFGR